MCKLLQLAAASLLLVAEFGGAQIRLHGNRPAAEDLSWMWTYTQPAPVGDMASLLHDARFEPLLAEHLKAPQTFWSSNKSLPKTVLEYLGQTRSVIGENNRYFIATGCVREFCANRGLLWVDLGAAHPLFVFAATNWIAGNKATDQKGAAYTLWVFSSRTLDPEHLPSPLTHSIAPWAAEATSDGTVEQIAGVVLVDPDGQPHQIQPAAIGIQNKQQSEQKAHS